VADPGRNARQRARMAARLSTRSAQTQLRAAEADASEEPDLAGSGKVEGTQFDWESNLYVDPETRALWDGGDLEAREIREALAADWKMRQLALLLTSPLKGATWKLVPGEGTGTAGEAAAKDIEEQLRRPANAGGMTVPMQRVIAQAASARVYRRAYFAKGFKLDPRAGDGSVMYSQLAMRPASTCHLRVDKKNGSFDGFVQDLVWSPDGTVLANDGKPVVFEPRKSLVFTNGLEQDPVRGISDLEVAMWCFRTKRKVMVLWLTFLSAHALPRTLVQYTGGDEERAKAAARMIATLSSGGVGYIDSTNMTIGGLNPNDRLGGSAPFMEMVKYLDTCQSGSILAGFTDLTSAAADGKGSLALHEGATAVFDQTSEQSARDTEHVLTNYCVADLVRYNHGPDLTVNFSLDPLSGANEGALMSLLQALATAQSSALPQEFINELAIHAARLLDLDVNKIRAALDRKAVQAREQAAIQGANAAGQAAASTNAAIEGVRQIAGQVAGHPSRPARGRPTAAPAAAPVTGIA
jgi:hypothetical protein